MLGGTADLINVKELGSSSVLVNQSWTVPFSARLWSAIIASPRHWLVSSPQAYDAHSTQHWTPEL
jgi:hypothetical protein